MITVNEHLSHPELIRLQFAIRKQTRELNKYTTQFYSEVARIRRHQTLRIVEEVLND